MLREQVTSESIVRKKKYVVNYRAYFVRSISGFCIVRTIKYRKMKWAEHIACTGEGGNKDFLWCNYDHMEEVVVDGDTQHTVL